MRDSVADDDFFDAVTTREPWTFIGVIGHRTAAVYRQGSLIVERPCGIVTAGAAVDDRGECLLRLCELFSDAAVAPADNIAA